jgi:hypothetical protein
VGYALVHVVFFENHGLRTLGEPAYSNLKRDLEAEGVQVRKIEVRVDYQGRDEVYPDIVLHKPNEGSAPDAADRVVRKFKTFAKARRLGFIVNYVDIEFRSPDSFVGDIPVED